MADNTAIIKLALIGGAGYLAYRMGWLSSLGIGTPSGSTSTPAPPPTVGASPAPAPPPASTPPAPPPNPYASVKLADLYTKFNTVANAARAAQLVSGGDPVGPDVYDSLLVQVFQQAGLPDPGLPDPNQVFGPGGWSRPYGMSVGTYWAGISAWLSANKGMSGFRGYAGLAGLARRRGWV